MPATVRAPAVCDGTDNDAVALTYNVTSPPPPPPRLLSLPSRRLHLPIPKPGTMAVCEAAAQERNA